MIVRSQTEEEHLDRTRFMYSARARLKSSKIRFLYLSRVYLLTTNSRSDSCILPGCICWRLIPDSIPISCQGTSEEFPDSIPVSSQGTSVSNWMKIRYLYPARAHLSTTAFPDSTPVSSQGISVDHISRLDSCILLGHVWRVRRSDSCILPGCICWRLIPDSIPVSCQGTSEEFEDMIHVSCQGVSVDD